MWLFLRNIFWAAICPGTVTLLLPRLVLSGSRSALPLQHWAQWIGIPVILSGALALIWCIYDFARRGKGTLSPLDPARRLVVSGLYRYVRNPMYVGVMAILIGESMLFRSSLLLGYSGLVFSVFNLFIWLHEEPYLRRQFGREYERYCEKVGRWLPGKPYQR